MINLEKNDIEIYKSVQNELNRQKNHIELIASENITSKAVLEACGSVLTNKYAEGYPSARYYSGCEYVDEVEELARSRVKELFQCEYANVQPHSGSQANQAVFFALLKPADNILGMSLDCGGHLTHGLKKNLSGAWFNPYFYGVNPQTGYIDYDAVRQVALEVKPKLIIAGFSAYTRTLDWKKFREIADEVGAYLMADIAHIAGLVAAGCISSPMPFADIVTSTTHKTLRGPRGGLILSNNTQIGKKIDSALFPGIQGGPLMHIIAAKAVAFKEALTPEYKDYIRNVMQNAKAMAETFVAESINLVSGGTDNHMILVDLRGCNTNGKIVANTIEQIGLICNKNGIPNDPLPPTVTSGIRIGTPAGTTRGFGTQEFSLIAKIISDVIKNINSPVELQKILDNGKEKVQELCDSFPIYS